MTLAPILQITRREVRDSLTDWRILLPIAILTLVLPSILLGAADFAIEFVGDPQLIATIVPFVALLIGFIPASFSLIAALESFVGERERNSLEALLAMPISDNELYTGKLLSSLVPPLFSSLLAVLFFTLTLGLSEPELWAGGMSLQILLLIVVLIIVKATTMVTGAVIISSHTTSIRAANLLASFVLLPMASIVQLEALLIIAKRWDLLWTVAAFLAVTTVALARTGMGAFNREEILSREHEQLNLRAIWATFRSFWNEYRPAGVPPEAYRAQRLDLGRFYRHELPQLLVELRLPLAMALLAALVGLATGPSFSEFFTTTGISAAAVGAKPLPEPNLLFAIAIGIGNAVRVLFAALISSLSFGVLSFLIPLFAFAGISFVANELVQRGGSWSMLGPESPLQFLLAYVLPHGIIELPTALLGAALGLRLGVALLPPPAGFSVGQNMLWSLAQLAKLWCFVLLPLFLLAGLIEHLLAPLLIQALYG